MPMKNPPHPGGLIRRQVIQPLGLSVTQAAAVLGVTRQALSLLLNERTDLSEKQLRLLDNAAAALLPGGRIVYSTCSLEKEENQRVVERFLHEHPEFRLLPLREEARRLQPFFHPASAWILENDFFVTSPARDGTDGFFAAVLVKKGSEE